MATEPPIACSLNAAEMRERLAEMAAIGESSLVTAETNDARAVLRFRVGAKTRERLEIIVAEESECCAFLRMELRDEPDAIVLAIEAPEGAEPVMSELVSAFSVRERAA